MGSVKAEVSKHKSSPMEAAKRREGAEGLAVGQLGGWRQRRCIVLTKQANRNTHREGVGPARIAV